MESMQSFRAGWVQIPQKGARMADFHSTGTKLSAKIHRKNGEGIALPGEIWYNTGSVSSENERNIERKCI